MLYAWYTTNMSSHKPRYSVYHLYLDGNHTVCGLKLTERWFIDTKPTDGSTRLCQRCDKENKHGS